MDFSRIGIIVGRMSIKGLFIMKNRGATTGHSEAPRGFFENSFAFLDVFSTCLILYCYQKACASDCSYHLIFVANFPSDTSYEGEQLNCQLLHMSIGNP